ncbi:hypothetical protein V6N13_084719 [Hibiscus sabdariffa]
MKKLKLTLGNGKSACDLGKTKTNVSLQNKEMKVVVSHQTKDFNPSIHIAPLTTSVAAEIPDGTRQLRADCSKCGG